jgi:hypothetical protein
VIKGLFNPIMWENMNKSILERSPLNAISVTKHSDGPKIERWGVHLIVSPICNIWKHKISSLSKDQYQSIVADDQYCLQNKTNLEFFEQIRWIVRFTICWNKCNEHLIKVHEMDHRDEKPYTCNHCDAKFKTSSCLKRHIKGVHSGEKRFECETCGLRFSESG